MCCDQTAEYSVCGGWLNGDVGGRKIRRLARSSRRGTLDRVVYECESQWGEGDGASRQRRRDEDAEVVDGEWSGERVSPSPAD